LGSGRDQKYTGPRPLLGNCPFGGTCWFSLPLIVSQARPVLLPQVRMIARRRIHRAASKAAATLAPAALTQRPGGAKG